MLSRPSLIRSVDVTLKALLSCTWRHTVLSVNVQLQLLLHTSHARVTVVQILGFDSSQYPAIALQGQLVKESANHRHPEACCSRAEVKGALLASSGGQFHALLHLRSIINIVKGLEAPAMAVQATLKIRLYMCKHFRSFPSMLLTCCHNQAFLIKLCNCTDSFC